ncbi:MAG: PQQ-binding-like beta-propeller repeat protein [Dermatophilaceae bacterium]
MEPRSKLRPCHCRKRCRTLYAHDLATGAPRWVWTDQRHGTDIGDRPNSTATVYGSRIFLTRACNALVAAVDRTTGPAIWQRQIHTELYGDTEYRLSVADETGALYVGSHDGGGRVRALEQSTGAERWSARVPGAVYRLALTDRVLVVASANGVTGLDRATGRRSWSRAMTPTDGGLATGGGLAFVADDSPEIPVLEVASGRLLRRIPVGVSTSGYALARGRLLAVGTSTSGERSILALSR